MKNNFKLYLIVFCCLFFSKAFFMNSNFYDRDTEESLAHINTLLGKIEFLGEDTLLTLRDQREVLGNVLDSVHDIDSELDKCPRDFMYIRKIAKYSGAVIGGAAGFYFGPIWIPLGAIAFSFGGDQLGEKLISYLNKDD